MRNAENAQVDDAVDGDAVDGDADAAADADAHADDAEVDPDADADGRVYSDVEVDEPSLDVVAYADAMG